MSKQTGLDWAAIRANYVANGGVEQPEVWRRAQPGTEAEAREPRGRPRKIRTEPRATPGLAKRPVGLSDQELRRRYDAGESLPQLEASTGVSRTTITRAILRAGGTMRRRGPARIELSPEKCAEIARRYVEGEAAYELAAEYGVGSAVITRTIQQQGGRMRGKSEAQTLNQNRRRNLSIQDNQIPELRRRYESGESVTGIAADLRLPRKSLTKVLIAAGVRMRTRSESIKLSNTHREKK